MSQRKKARHVPAGIAGDSAMPDRAGPAPELDPPSGSEDPAAKPVCIVGIGGSASAAEAFAGLLATFERETEVAFVVVDHAQSDEHARLRDLLVETIQLPVAEASPGELVRPGHVVLVPSGSGLVFADGRLVPDAGPSVERGEPLPVDAMLRSLALARRSRAIAVILSGTGTDGSLGIQAVKAEGGITFAQDLRSAKSDAMPLSAVSTGCVDFMLPVADIGAEIASLAKRLRATPGKLDGEPDLEQEEDLRRIFAVLRAAHEVDFTLYRHSTIKRRISRRMVLNKVASVRDYLLLLKDRPIEVEALYQDILIKVTHFFRDPEAFEALKRHVFPALLSACTDDAPIRIWVPGCSTGEEVYSIAITLLELTTELRVDVPFQIFATDISEAALEKARTGAYIENIAMDVSPERLRRYFVKTGKLYQINKSIRDLCVFARQNVTRDPPFSKLDLISCRNVMIYLEPVLQKRVIPVFHYALRPAGYLVLGASETIGGMNDLFTLVDKRSKIYARTVSPARFNYDLSGAGQYGPDRVRPEKPVVKPSDRAPVLDAQKEADRVIMNRYAPAGVIVNSELQIVQFRGRTGPYLEPASGEASLNVLKMAREGLMLDLRAAINKAKRTDVTVRSEGVQVRSDGQVRDVAIEVIPLKDPVGIEATAAERCFLVLFEEQSAKAPSPRAAKPDGSKAPKPADRRIAKLEQELLAAREYLQVTIEEQEATNEELQSANEELLSSNEELQSINEELETAKEELQSTNEALTTLNEELEARNVELARLNNDLGNLLSSVNIPMVMLSRDLRIRRFTPQAEPVLNLIPSDVGRPIGDIKPRIQAPDLEPLLAEVLAAASPREIEVQDRDGHWYSMCIRPYRTADDKVDGAVILLVDIDRIKRSWQGEPTADRA